MKHRLTWPGLATRTGRPKEKPPGCCPGQLYSRCSCLSRGWARWTHPAAAMGLFTPESRTGLMAVVRSFPRDAVSVKPDLVKELHVFRRGQSPASVAELKTAGEGWECYFCERPNWTAWMCCFLYSMAQQKLEADTIVSHLYKVLKDIKCCLALPRLLIMLQTV